MKQVKLSKSADMKIRIRLYIAACKKNFQFISFIKMAVPALMIGIFSIGVFQFMNPENTQTIIAPQAEIQASSISASDYLKTVRSDKYRAIAKKRAYAQKAKKYKNYAYVRSSSLRVR